MATEPACVRDLMTKDVVTLERNDKLSLADNVMRLGRIRHMVVLNEAGEVTGVVSQRDLFQGALMRAMGYGTTTQKRMMDTILVKEVMSTDLLTTTPDTPVPEAARLMAERKFGCLPVIEGGKLEGIVTEGDFVAYFAHAS